MNNIIESENTKIEDMIYEIRGKEVILESEILRTKYRIHLYDKMIMHYDIGKSKSVFNNFIMGVKIIWN